MNPAPIFDFFFAYQKTAAMQAAVDIGLFTAIGAGHSAVPQIARVCEASPKGVRILCDYWAVNGLLAKSGDFYRLTPEAGTFLDRKSPAYIGGTMAFINGPITSFFSHLTDTVRRGGLTDAGTVKSEYEGWIPFAEQMGAMMFPTAQGIAGLLGPVSGRVLDVAAGHGLFGLILAQRNSGVNVVALDWPKVLDVAKKNAARFNLADRFSTIPGDAFTVDFKGPYELVLLTNILHHFDQDTCVKLLRKSREALRPGGRLAILDFVPNADRVSPPMSATFPLVMLATTASGDAYTFAEYEKMLRTAGFSIPATLHQIENSPQQLIVAAA